jgi:quercetin dioxygenase-like cupin family protein
VTIAQLMPTVLVAGMAVTALNAQPSPSPVLHDLGAIPELELNANIRIKKVMGEVGTFALGKFRAGFKSTPHHHTYEQINIGLTGAFALPVAGVRHTVSAMRGVAIPPDVEHNNDVPGDAGDPALIEFQSARRLDFPPERQQIALPIGPTALSVPPGRQVAFDFGSSSPGWQAIAKGVRMHARTGGTTAISAWELASTVQDAITLRLLLPGAEQFVYVVDGVVEATSEARRFAMRSGALLVNPSGGQPLRLGRQGNQPALLLVFEARH